MEIWVVENTQNDKRKIDFISKSLINIQTFEIHWPHYLFIHELWIYVSFSYFLSILSRHTPSNRGSALFILVGVRGMHQ